MDENVCCRSQNESLASNHHGELPLSIVEGGVHLLGKNVQGGPSAETVGLGLLGFGMFHHLALAVGSYSSGPPAGGTPQSKVNPTQLSQQMDLPVNWLLELHT